MLLYFAIFLLNSQNSHGLINTNMVEENINSFRQLLEEVMIKSLQPYKCVAVISDETYNDLFEQLWFKRFGALISFVMINIDESEDLLYPTETTKYSLLLAKLEGCQLYIILLANGLQVTRLLRYGDRYRVLDTRSKYIFLFDNRLFQKEIFYIWKRIINVIFIKEYGGQKKENLKEKNKPWFEITTVPFPSPITSVLIPKRLDIWAQNRFRKGADLFRDKTMDLRNQTLKIVAFSHLPGTAKNEKIANGSVRAILGNDTTYFSGAEVEILRTVSNAMNFQCDIYEPFEADIELWGRKQVGGKFTGVIGEMVSNYADIALGDLYYTPYLLELMDLSVPYNTECLTFLTPESLRDNSWKTLILPFTAIMWAGVIICLIVCGIIFYTLAKFHKHVTKEVEKVNKEQQFNDIHSKKKKIITLSIFPENLKGNPDIKYMIMKEQYQPPTIEGQPMGLYQFSEPFNSMLYTYSMLLLVSLPKLPTGWSLRMLTGWYWLYSLLVVVAYRASMTAILARPQPRVTIDTLEELMDSKLTYGGWGEINRQFFKSALESTSQTIGAQFEIVNDSAEAVDRVATASFAFYENIYFLKEAIVKRQMRFQMNYKNNSTTNNTQEARNIAKEDRSLHIMSDCIINMPISIGLQKNSPIKPRMDKFIRRVLEAGLVKKWLADVMQSVLNADAQNEGESIKALMNMKKFFGALVALFTGYFISVVALIVEILYFNYVVKKNPNFNKYSRSVQVIKKSD